MRQIHHCVSRYWRPAGAVAEWLELDTFLEALAAFIRTDRMNRGNIIYPRETITSAHVRRTVDGYVDIRSASISMFDVGRLLGRILWTWLACPKTSSSVDLSINPFKKGGARTALESTNTTNKPPMLTGFIRGNWLGKYWSWWK